MKPRTDEQLLANYLDGERLKVIPKKRGPKMAVLRWLVGRFAVDIDYPEHEVNTLLSTAHPDYATLRRELYDAHLMDRENGVYRRRRPVPMESGPEVASNLQLERPSAALATSFAAMRDAFLAAGNDQWTGTDSLAHQDAVAFAEMLCGWSEGRNLPDGWGPADAFWIVRDEVVVG